eukprot:4803380-Amphidinium_carterae.1
MKVGHEGQPIGWDEAGVMLNGTSPERLDLCAEVAKQSLNASGKRGAASMYAELGGIWHEERAHTQFNGGDACVKWGKDKEDLNHIVNKCPC